MSYMRSKYRKVAEPKKPPIKGGAAFFVSIALKRLRRWFLDTQQIILGREWLVEVAFRVLCPQRLFSQTKRKAFVQKTN